MVNNRLIQSLFTVVIFWYVILIIPSDADWSALVPSISHSALIVGLGVLGGVLSALILKAWKVGDTLHRLLATGQRGLILSVGLLPAGKAPPPRVEEEGTISVCFKNWMSGFKMQHSKHANLMLAVYNSMAAAHLLPASPVPGGHGGATLIQHSENMLNVALEMAPSWKYEGHINKSGKVVFPPIDDQYCFDPSDPIIPVCALAHDIGKIECYRLREDGLVDEVKANHDEVGGRMLLTLPEYWELPKADREALTLCVTFYHHIAGMPLWVDDRTRALTELIIAADVETAKREGDTSREHKFSFMETAAESFSVPDLPQDIVSSMATLAEQALPFSGQSSPKKTAVAVVRIPAVVPSGGDSAEADWAYNAFEDLLAEPGRINGNDKNTRIGFKYGDWVYVSDAHLRSAIAENLEQPRIAELAGRGQMHSFTFALMEKLMAMGALMTTWNGAQFSTKRALFNMVAHGTGGKVVSEWKFTLIFKASLFPHVNRLKDCRYVPEITAPAWGATSAFNKAGNDAQQANDDDTEAEDGLPEGSAVADIYLPDGDEIEDKRGESEIKVNSADVVCALKAMANDLDTMTPFKLIKQDGAEFAYFPESFVSECFSLTANDPAPEGAKWAKGEGGKVFFGVQLSNEKGR